MFSRGFGEYIDFLGIKDLSIAHRNLIQHFFQVEWAVFSGFGVLFLLIERLDAAQFWSFFRYLRVI